MKERGNRGCKQLAEQGEHDARPGSGDHRASAVENKRRQGRGGQGRSPVLHYGGRSRPLRSGQDLTGSAVLAGAALLLSHRDHEPSCEASDDG